MKSIVREVSWDQVERRISDLFESGVIGEKYACIVLSLGGLSYKKIKKSFDFDFVNEVVVRKYVPNTWFARGISKILPSFWGAAMVNLKCRQFVKLVDSLTDQSMVELLVVEKKIEPQLVKHIREQKSPIKISEYVSGLPSFFVYGVDTDNPESKTGTLEIIKFEEDCPSEIIRMVQLY